MSVFIICYSGCRKAWKLIVVRVVISRRGRYTDVQLWDVLESVDMKDAIKSLPNGLLEPVAESGDNFSAGQRQVKIL